MTLYPLQPHCSPASPSPVSHPILCPTTLQASWTTWRNLNLQGLPSYSLCLKPTLPHRTPIPFTWPISILSLGYNSDGTSYRRKLFLAFQGWDDAHPVCLPSIFMAQIAACVTLRDSCMVSGLLSFLDLIALSVLTIVSPTFSIVPEAE